MVGWDLDREDWRIFRLDRTTEPHVTKRCFEPRTLPTTNAAAFVAERLSSLPSTYQVKVVIAAPSDQVKHHLGPWGSVETIDADANSTEIRMGVDDLNWVVLILAAIDADITHVEPPELAMLLRTLGRRFTSL